MVTVNPNPFQTENSNNLPNWVFTAYYLDFALNKVSTFQTNFSGCKTAGYEKFYFNQVLILGKWPKCRVILITLAVKFPLSFHHVTMTIWHWNQWKGLFGWNKKLQLKTPELKCKIIWLSVVYQYKPYLGWLYVVSH